MDEYDVPVRFTAPLLPGRSSWIQQYFQLSRWLTIPAIVLVGLMMVWLLQDFSKVWLTVILVAIPINFIGFHLLAARVFANMDLEQKHDHRMIIDDESIEIMYPDKDPDHFSLEELKNVKIIYSGYERAFFPSGKYFNGAQNQLLFQCRGRKFSLRFRLISRRHFHELKEMLVDWYEMGLEFEEFNRTSGLPVKTQLFEVQ
ncbi:MAG: hypothetical protein R3B93_12655 [Bacteroidia bacterium]